MSQKKWDVVKTLTAYEKRIELSLVEDLQELDGAFLSTFDCYSTITHDVPNTHHLCNHAVVLMRLARRHKVNVLGVTSERRQKGQYCVDLPSPYSRERTPVIYVGKHNYFTNHRSSKWRLLPADRVRCSE